MNIEQLLPSARPLFARFVYEVIKPGSLWRQREVEDKPLFETQKVDFGKRWST